MTIYDGIKETIEIASDERVLKEIAFRITYEISEKTITKPQGHELLKFIDEKRELIKILKETNKGTENA